MKYEVRAQFENGQLITFFYNDLKAATECFDLLTKTQQLGATWRHGDTYREGDRKGQLVPFPVCSIFDEAGSQAAVRGDKVQMLYMVDLELMRHAEGKKTVMLAEISLPYELQMRQIMAPLAPQPAPQPPQYQPPARLPQPAQQPQPQYHNGTPPPPPSGGGFSE